LTAATRPHNFTPPAAANQRRLSKACAARDHFLDRPRPTINLPSRPPPYLSSSRPSLSWSTNISSWGHRLAVCASR